jgi:hypothetical protein
LAETPAADRGIQTAYSFEPQKKFSRPVIPPSNSSLSQKSILNSDSRSSTAQKVSQPTNNASKLTSLSPDSDHANQSLKKKSGQIFSPSLDMDPDVEFADKRLRASAYRKNKKGLLEGRGRFERVPSKVPLQKSANTPKKTSPAVPKLIKARRMDVFIPSTLSVATLAKLLNVKLGT